MQRLWLFCVVLATALILVPAASAATSKYRGTLSYTPGDAGGSVVEIGDGSGSGCRYVEPMYSERSWFFDSGYDFGVGLHWCWSGGRITQCSAQPILSVWGYWRWSGSIYGPHTIHTNDVCGFDWIGSFTLSSPWSADEYRTHALSPRGYSNGTSR